MSGSLGGSTKKKNSTQTTSGTQTGTMASTTNPWGPTAGYLETLLGNIGTAGGNLGKLTAGQTGALGEIAANADTAGQFTPSIEALTRDLFSHTSSAPMASDAYSTLKAQLGDVASGARLNPMDDPHMRALLAQVGDDASTRVHSMFAGAGRDLSPEHAAASSRAVTSATAPILVSQYNANADRQAAAAQALYGAGTQTAQTVQALDANALATRERGIATAQAALDSANLPASIRLQIENALKTMPMEELAPMVQYLTTLAGVGSSATGTQTQTGTQRTTGAQTETGSQWGLGLKWPSVG